MNKQIISLLLLACFVHNGYAQVISLGRCPPVTVDVDVDLDRYLGVWFSVQQFRATFSEGTCISAEYGLNDNGTISVLNSQIDANGELDTILGHAVVDSPGKLLVNFPNSPVPGNYWILSTDHDNYSVVYSCTNVLLVRVELAWILTRDRTPDAAIIEKAREVFTRNQVNVNNLNDVDQTNCE